MRSSLLLPPGTKIADAGIVQFTAAFAIAYDWFYDYWSDAQKLAIRTSIVNLGLQYGLNAYADRTGAGADYTWWTKVNGNWK